MCECGAWGLMDGKRLSSGLPPEPVRVGPMHTYRTTERYQHGKVLDASQHRETPVQVT